MLMMRMFVLVVSLFRLLVRFMLFDVVMLMIEIYVRYRI